jgi:hypothetical protein
MIVKVQPEDRSSLTVRQVPVINSSEAGAGVKQHFRDIRKSAPAVTTLQFIMNSSRVIRN